MGRRDGFQDELVPEAAGQVRHQADADLLRQFVWGASDGARRDAWADENPEDLRLPDADAEKSAVRERAGRVTDGSRLADRGEQQWAGQGAAA